MEYEIKKDDEYGYKHISPIPSLRVVSSFYEGTFAELVEEGKTGPGMRRLLEGGKKAEWEREWRRSTWYSDIVHFTKSINPDAKTLLDVGCGLGEFLRFAEDQGFDTTGVEPSDILGQKARDRGLNVYMDRVEEFSEYCDRTFDVVSLLEVLHHVRKPAEVIRKARNLISDGGVIIVKVPNDFNTLQEVILSEKETDRWWVNPPMIINYFNHKSLKRLLHIEGLDVSVSYSDFPMEIFPLMGDDYVSGQASGKDCHKKRVFLEKLVPNELRRKIYKVFAKFGVGRNVTCIAKKSAL